MIHESLRRKLVHETAWSRTFEVEPGFHAYESKFEADGISVNVQDVTAKWESWDMNEKLDFAKAFQAKRDFSQSDEQVLDLLMEKGDDRVRATIALSLTRHSDKVRVLRFLSERATNQQEGRGNFIQALYVLGDRNAVPGLRKLHDKLQKHLSEHGRSDLGLVFSFLTCCEALAALDSPAPYNDEIRLFLDDANELIRLHAERALAGPQPEEFLGGPPRTN
jgi:hypothetical protein